VPIRWNGWKRRSTWSGEIVAPVLLTERTARLAFCHGRNVEAASGLVVVYRVIDQVGHHALDEAWVTCRNGLGKCDVDVDALIFGLLAAVENDAAGDLAKIERLPALDGPLAGREREQCVDQPSLLGTEVQRLLAGRSQALCVGVWVGQVNLQEGSLSGERRAQLMGRVSHELAL
jgi:hypothetical protein